MSRVTPLAMAMQVLSRRLTVLTDIGEKNADMAARANCRLENMRDEVYVAIGLLQSGKTQKALRKLLKAEKI